MPVFAIFAAGVLHGLGPDHLAAISGFGAATGAGASRLALFAVRFALGHVGIVVAAGILGRFGYALLPVAWEPLFEIGAGALLALTGIVLLAGLLTGRIAVHAHAHEHGEGRHRHFHLHLGTRGKHRHVHGSFAFALGGLFALGGARSLLAVAPLTMTRSTLQAGAAVVLFTVGIVLAMWAYGMLAGRLLARTSHALTARAAAFAVAAFCVVAGLWTITHGLTG